MINKTLNGTIKNVMVKHEVDLNIKLNYYYKKYTQIKTKKAEEMKKLIETKKKQQQMKKKKSTLL